MTPLTADRQIIFGTSSSILAPSAYIRPWEGELSKQYGSASLSLSIADALTHLWLTGVNIEDSMDVENFLANHYGVVAHLYEIQEKVSQYFGKAKLKLGLFFDPDGSEEEAELYLEVETTLSPEEAHEAISKLNREWLIASGDQDLMSLNITLKFA